VSIGIEWDKKSTSTAAVGVAVAGNGGESPSIGIGLEQTDRTMNSKRRGERMDPSRLDA
jgi:hypothetical protein